MPTIIEALKEQLEKLNTLSEKTLTKSKIYIQKPEGAPTMDFPVAKKMWAHIDVVNEAFKTCLKDGLIIPEKEEEFLKTVLPEVEYMNGKWAKWKDIEEYRGQIRDMASKFKTAKLFE